MRPREIKRERLDQPLKKKRKLRPRRTLLDSRDQYERTKRLDRERSAARRRRERLLKPAPSFEFTGLVQMFADARSPWRRGRLAKRIAALCAAMTPPEPIAEQLDASGKPPREDA